VSAVGAVLERTSARSLVRGALDPYWFICSLGATVLLAAASVLPLWHMHFWAPQYPKGLHLTAYGTRLEGDLAELNALNHYIGVSPIEESDIPELALFPFLVAGLIGLVFVGSFVARRRLLRLAVIAAIWMFLIGFLVDLQWWLYRAGHNLDPEAPVRVDQFTPRVLGETNVVNFSSEAIPSAGLWLVFAAALLVTFGPPILRFLHSSWQNTGETKARDTAPAAGDR
jgi:hypothetical protein